ncbi:YdcF family protein [Vibrio sp. AH4]|uniref:YdcF family protein n=1 Tax=Vibrio sp. AH4 TaxID=2919577 RepID=UPI00273936CD|nr:YdcF family protein [Vibrio sp. AH4]MDP4493860.1 YdcF family protein [Vibrio sp. AH4]
MPTTRPIFIVLGKRLNSDQLTLEGKSRVEGLISALQCHENQTALVVFCGGVTQRQSASEAQRMYEYFQTRCQQLALSLPHVQVLLEQQSTSTVENIEHVAQVLLTSGHLRVGDTLTLTLVSNDYHLKRIFEIQQLMDEQGLLRTLDERCQQAGVRLNISRDLNAHINVPYPHRSQQGVRFLWVDELTTYRVFLEGVTVNAFQRPLEEVRQAPYQIAQTALAQLRRHCENEPIMLAQLALIATVVESEADLTTAASVGDLLAVLDTELTLLNRLCDPELDRTGRWWKR